MSGDTIAAVATAPGRAGVAVVRVSGPDSFRIASLIVGRCIDAKLAGRFFHVEFRAPDDSRSLLDDGLLLVFAGPHSYTGEDVVELQGHGGSVAPRRLLEACLAAGARLARRGEFTERAFLNGRLDLGAAEAVLDLIDARTARAADDALGRLGGAVSRELESFYAQAIELSSRLEHALDFDEEELPEDFTSGLRTGIEALSAKIRRRLSTAREGRILREGALVVLAGAPNVGKSSLLNVLLGERRAIVSATAGTTRDSIEEWMEIKGWPIRLVDTAGLRTTSDAIEGEGVERAETLIGRADLVLRLRSSDTDEAVGRTRPRRSAALPVLETASKEIPVWSKCDLGGDGGDTALRVSAQTGEGLAELKDEIARRLTKLAAKDDESTGADVTTRQQEGLLRADEALQRARQALDGPDYVVAANELRATAEALGGILGKFYSEDLLDALFSRFCVGK